ncbi:MAG TPA: DNA polymerase IV [Candidatus Polarisedimenticolia bacterium]|jgi:DNA polymerase-4|nr:DNA polymerase IV [Candidatus Polarisedimenticolia bacterium]
MLRSVLHVDIAAFPIAVERVIEPHLRGRPVLVAPPGSARAPVWVVSQEAAREGVRTGMPLPVALRRCPGVAVLHPNEALYRRATGALLSLLGGFSPLIEPAALGQTFLDLTGTGRLFGAAQDAAVRIRREIEARLRLKPTVGLATSKLVSRVAARVIRPDGLCDVFPGSEAPFLAPLPVGLLPAAHGETRERLSDLNVARVADLLRFSPAQLLVAFGRQGGRLRGQALGIDASPVRPPEEAVAVVEEETLAEDSNHEAVLLRALFGLCERAGARLRRLQARAGRLRVTLRHSDDVLARREERLPLPVAADLPLFAQARGICERARARRVRVRWIELRCLEIARAPRQLELFRPAAFDARARDGGAAGPLAEAMDRIRGRFGGRAILSGRMFAGRAVSPAEGGARSPVPPR